MKGLCQASLRPLAGPHLKVTKRGSAKKKGRHGFNRARGADEATLSVKQQDGGFRFQGRPAVATAFVGDFRLPYL